MAMLTSTLAQYQVRVLDVGGGHGRGVDRHGVAVPGDGDADRLEHLGGQRNVADRRHVGEARRLIGQPRVAGDRIAGFDNNPFRGLFCRGVHWWRVKVATIPMAAKTTSQMTGLMICLIFDMVSCVGLI